MCPRGPWGSRGPWGWHFDHLSLDHFLSPSLYFTYFILFFYCVCHMTVGACGGQKFTLDVFLYGSLLEVPWRIWPQFQDLIRTFLWFLGTQLYACVLGLPLFSSLAFPWPIFLPVRSWAVTDKGFCVKCVPLSVDTCLLSEWVLETWILLSVTNGRQEMRGIL